MSQPLSLIISVTSLLLLLMPTSVGGMITTAVVFLLITGLIIYKKPNTPTYETCDPQFFHPVSILISLCLGLLFYDRWSSAAEWIKTTAVLYVSIRILLFVAAAALVALSLKLVRAAIHWLFKKLSEITEKNAFTRELVSCLLAAVVTVVLAQTMIEAAAFSMGFFKFLVGVLIVSVAILLLYCLLTRCIPAIAIGTGLFMVISTINVYVYKFRGRLFEPVDIFSAGTAMNVMENYSLFPIPITILSGWGLYVAMLMLLNHLQHKTRPAISFKKRLALLAVCAVSSVAIFFYASDLKTYHWHKQGAEYNGSVLDFVSKFKEITVPEPENYSMELMDQLAEEYSIPLSETQVQRSELPHIIVIMDESFSDLHVVGDFTTNTELMPFISSLKENAISGYALSSVYGGNTANSEYEFLTGNSLAWLSPNVVPYQQYIRSSTYSMVSYLKGSYDYKAIAMHPYDPSGWNRPNTYQHLGFDESYFIDDFPQEDILRYYVSDREMFDFLIDTFEANKDRPLLIHSVTMQNHGGYTYEGEDFTKHISLTDHPDAFPEVEQYLSLVHETDKAVEDLIAYFQEVEEDVVIVFFGDHQPGIDESFYEAVSDIPADTLDEQQKRYMVPFFIWTNYDIEERYIDCISLNYLASYVYDVAGIPLPPYNRFLREMEAQIPCINANGFYSLEAGCYLPLEEANETERAWLDLYEVLQYNNLFDKENQNEDLFPILAE